jgi:hypothetical protein
MMKIRMEDIVDAIATSTKDTDYFYDLETGDLEMMVDGEVLGNSDIDLSNEERYIKLPDRYELDEEDMMTTFAKRADDPAMQAKLLQAISQDDTYKAFHNLVEDLNMSDQWNRFREDVFRQSATEWCEYNGIDYVEGDPDKVIEDAIYRHFKGARYKVLGVARDSETLDELVIYQSMDKNRILWARPKKMFCEMVTVEGNEVPRFQLAEMPDNIDN